MECPECNQVVSRKASVCVHCGHPLTYGYQVRNGLIDYLGFLIGLVGLFFLGLLFFAVVFS
jgi:hypothetical protein